MKIKGQIFSDHFTGDLVQLKKTVPGLPYKRGQYVPVYKGRDDAYLWHVWRTIIKVPDDCIQKAITIRR